MPRFVITAASHRTKTEDRARVLAIADGCIACVADGVGGMSGAAVAAESFVSGIQRVAAAADFDITDPTAWTSLLTDLDEEIARAPGTGETTGIALAFRGSSLVGASVGNSRAYLFTDGGPHELTHDQHHRPRLGSGRSSPQPFSAKATGTLVMASDGLFDYASLDDIAHVVATRRADTGDALVQLVRDRHTKLPDDVVIVVAQLADRHR